MFPPSIWHDYYEKTHRSPPRDTLVQALASFATSGQAIDLGCGAGRDTLPLLAAGWQVLAVDAEAEAIKRLMQIIPAQLTANLQTQILRFEEITTLPPAMLINASYSLPFCSADAFASVWQIICHALQPNGRFVGHFFGPEDDWASQPEPLIHTQKDLQAMFKTFTIETWHERRIDRPAINRIDKHWHIFSIIAKKEAS